MRKNVFRMALFSGIVVCLIVLVSPSVFSEKVQYDYLKYCKTNGYNHNYYYSGYKTALDYSYDVDNYEYVTYEDSYYQIGNYFYSYYSSYYNNGYYNYGCYNYAFSRIFNILSARFPILETIFENFF